MVNLLFTVKKTNDVPDGSKTCIQATVKRVSRCDKGALKNQWDPPRIEGQQMSPTLQTLGRPSPRDYDTSYSSHP